MQAENLSQIPWAIGFQVAREILGIKKQRKLAQLLGITDAAISDAKKRGVFPGEWAKTIEIMQKKSWQELVRVAGADQQTGGVSVARQAALESTPFDVAMQSWFNVVKQWCRAEYGDDDAAAQAFIREFGDKFIVYSEWLARRPIIKNSEERGLEPVKAALEGE